MKRMEQYYLNHLSGGLPPSMRNNHSHVIHNNGAGGKSGYKLASVHQKDDTNLSNWIKHLLGRDSFLRPFSPASPPQTPPAVQQHKKIEGNTNDGGTELLKPSEFIFTFRFRHLLLGLLKYVTLYVPTTLSPTALSPAHLSIIQKSNFPNKEETFILLYEIFSYLLPFGPHQEMLMAVNGNSSSNQTNDLMRCLPFLTYQMLKLSFAVKRDHSVRWIFWSLAQKLLKFNEKLRLYFNSLMNITLVDVNSLQDYSIAGGNSLHSNHHLHNDSENHIPISALASPTFTTPKRRVSYNNSNMKALTDNQNIHRPNSSNPLSMTFSPLDIAMETPFKELNGENAFSSTKQGESQKRKFSTDNSRNGSHASGFKIDDLVDGLCILPNGSKRWFPGKIVEVIPRLQGEFLYTVLFNDGEMGKEKSKEEIRLTKNRARKAPPTKNNNDNSKSNSETAPKVQNPAESSNAPSAEVAAESHSAVKSHSAQKVPELNIRTELPADNTASHTSLNASLNSPELLLSPGTEKSISPLPPVRNPKAQAVSALQIKKEMAADDFLQSSESLLAKRLEESDLNSFSMSFVKQVDEFDVDEQGNHRRISGGERVDDEDEDLQNTSGEESEEDRIYEIPSIFDNHHRQQVNKRHIEEVVPRMQFTNLPISSALPAISASPSLSSSLLAETTPSDASSFFPSMNSGRELHAPASGRKYSARSQGGGGSSVATATAGISFYKNGHSNSGMGTSRSHYLVTQRSGVGLTQRSEFDDPSMVPNSSRSLPHGKRTPNRRRSLSNTGGELVSASVNAASSMHSMSREVFLQRGAGNMIGAAATVLSSGYNSVRSTPVPEIYDRLPTSTYYWLAQPEHLDVLLETFTTIVMMLLVYSFHEESGDLDYNCCFHHPDMNTVAEDLPIHTITQRLSSKSVDSTDSTSMSFLRKDGGGGLKGGVSVSEAADITMMNCIYIIREFMELTFPSSQAHLVSSTGITNPYASPMSGALRSPVSGIMANFHSPPTGLVSSSNLSTIAQIQTTVMRTLSQFILYVNPTMEMIRLSKLLHPSYFHQHQNGSSNTKIANYLIPMNKFEKQYSQDPYDTELNKIGEGAFGTVYRLIITNKENKGQNQQNHFNQGHISEEEGGSGRKMISESRRNSSLRGILSPSPSIRSGGNQSVVPRASWDSFYQYSHCFTCYRREHYPSAFDDEDENEDDLEQVTPSNTSSLPLEYSRTYENVTAANLASTTPYTSSAHSNSLRISNNVFCQCWKSQFLTGKNGKQPKKIKRKVFAVKKLMRERSIHDLSMVYNLYQEILCLEKLSECIGICGIEDYGLSNTSQEYIMILENGFMNILEWRQHYLLYKNDIYSFYTQERIPFSSNAFSSSSATILVNHQLPPTAFSPIGKVNVEVTCAPDLTNTVPSFDETTTHYQTNPHKPIATPAFPSPALLRHTGGAGLSMKSYHELLSYYQQYGGKAMEGIMEWDMLLFFHLYYEMLLILQYTHHQKIIHFDIKLANFILRDHPIHHFEYIRYMHSIGKVSGILFLTDFGEAIFNIQQCSNKKILQKSRGTVPIQSPEMLSISESQSHNANNPDRRKKSKGSGTAASGYDRDNDEQESMLMMSENVLQRKPLFLQTPEEIQRTTTFSHYHQSHQINYSPHHANHPNHDQQSITSASTFSQRKTNQIQFPLPDYSSDIWSIGCLFFELLTAEMLFQQQSFPELYTKLCLQPFPPPHQTSSNSSFVIDAMNQFLQKNVQELQQLATSSSSSATVSSSLSLPKEKLNQLFLSILQQNPCQRLALSQIVIEMKDIIDEYSQLTIVKVQTSEKIHQQEEKKKKENNHQNDTKMRNKNDKGKKDYSEPPPRTLSEQPSTHHQVSAQSLFSHESQLFHSTTVQKTQMPPHTKHDSVLTLSHDDEDDYEKRKFGNASVGKQDTFNTMIAEEEEEEKESEGTSSLFVVDLTDEKKALLSRPAPSNAKTTGVQNPASASKRTSLSQLLNAPPIQSHNTDCLRFSQNLFLLPDAQFHELLNALPTLHLLQTMSKQHSVAQNTSLQTSPPKTLNSSSQSWLKPCLELENNNNSYYDSFMTAAPSSSLPDKNGVSNSLSLSVAASLTSLIISPVKKGGSPRKGAATSLDDPIRAIPPIGTHLQSGAIKNNNSLLLQPNYQLFSPNLALEQIFQPHQHRAPPAPSSPHANHDDRHDPSHNSSGQSLNFMDNSQNRLGSGANGMMGHYWMEGIPSLLLKDLLTHYQYYCLEYSYAPPPNMHHLTSLPHSADHSNNITPPPNTSTMTGTTTPPATVKGVEKNHGTAQKQQNTLISQITPYPIIGLYLKYQIMTKEDMKHQGYYHQNSFRPKIHYERHGKLSQIIYYTLYIPIIIDESHSSLTEQEEGAGDASSSLRIELSIDRVIEVLQDFLLIHFIPTYAHPSSLSNASSASSSSSTTKNPKPLVFIFYDDMTKLEEEKELKRVIQLTKEKNNNKEASKLSHNTNKNQKNTTERTKEENKESIDEEEKNERSDIFHQIQEEKYWIEKKGLIVKMIQEKIIQILNSIKLVLSGFITRYLQEDVTSSAPSISSCGTIENPLSIEHQMGDALQSILQSILTFTRYLCIASSSSSSSMNNMNDNNNGHDSSSDNKNKGNNSTGLTYSMGLIERLLYYFFASLQHDPSHNNNDPQATGKKYYQKLKNNNHDHNNKDPLVKTSSQLKRLASIRHILLMENNSRTNLSSATSPHNMHSVRRSDEITPEPLQPPHQHIHLRSQAKQRSVFSYLWESASSLSLSRGVSVHMAISGKSIGTNISSRNKNKQRSKKIIRK